MTLPVSFSADEVNLALGTTARQLDRLVREGKVGFIRAGRSRRFLVEHLEQIRAAIEVKPRAQAPEFTGFPGQSSRSIARHRRSA